MLGIHSHHGVITENGKIDKRRLRFKIDNAAAKDEIRERFLGE